jgi:hypothetical protein
MALKSRTKQPQIQARGIARYPSITQPNTRFAKKGTPTELGTYEANIVVTKEVADELKDTLRPLYEEEYRKVQEDNAGKKIEQTPFPIEDFEGSFLVKIKKSGGWRNEQGVMLPSTPIAIFDSKAQPIEDYKDLKLWSGSDIVVTFAPNFWYVPSKGFGVSFKPLAVQVIKLGETGLSAKGAEHFGFTAQEEGFVNGGENLEGGFDAEETEEEVIANF